MRSTLRRTAGLMAAILLFTAAAPKAQAEEQLPDFCSLWCSYGAGIYCGGQTPDWCAAWFLGCMIGCRNA